tara:strand:- start:17513 stop:18256 length:744 start_codon:yes stop_codon:yes gene_type:complete
MSPKKYKETYGTRPSPISRTSVDPTDTQKESVKANQEVLDDASALSGSASEIDLTNRIKLMEQAISGYSDMTGKAAQLASDWMSGKFSGGDRVADRAAARGFSLGFDSNDTQFVNFGELSNYGKEIIDMQQQGLAAYNQLTSNAMELVGNPMSVTSMFTNPQQLFTQRQSESNASANIASWNASLSSMPNPSLVAQADDERMKQVSATSSRNNAFLGYAGGGPTNPYTGGLSARYNRQGYSSIYRSA